MILKLIKPERWWLPAKFEIENDRFIQNVKIPKGETTDGASVPFWLPFLGLFFVAIGHVLPVLYLPALLLIVALAIFPRFGASFDAALLHDFLLRSSPAEWRKANKLFFKQLIHDDIKQWRALTMFYVVTVYQFIKVEICRVGKS